MKSAPRKDTMEFLKEIYGDKALTYDELAAALKNNKSIVLGNLAGGAYVDKGKFDAKDGELQGKVKELSEAQNLIAQLKKDNKGNEDMQGKITEYEATVAALQNELSETKLDSALKLALVGAKAIDVDYLSYKIKNGDTEITLDDNGNIKGLDDMIEAMKKQYPTQFEAAAAKKVDENILPNGDPKGDPVEPKSLAEALKENYTPKDE